MNEIRTFLGHTKPVFELRVAGAGAHFLSRSLDGTARLWETVSGRTITEFPDADTVVAFSPDGTRMVRAGKDGAASLLDTATQREVIRFEGHVGDVLCASVSPDGLQVLTGGRDKTVRLWDVETGLPYYRLETYSPMVGADFSPKGKTAVACEESCSIFEFDLESGEVIRDLSVGEQDFMFGGMYTPGGTGFVYFAHSQRLIDLWINSEVLVPDGPSTYISCMHHRCIGPDMAFSKDDRLMGCVGREGVSVFQTKNGDPVTWVPAKAANSIVFSPDAGTLFCSGAGGTHLFGLPAGNERVRFPPTPTPANWAVYLPDGNQLLTAHGDPRAADPRVGDNVVRLWSGAAAAK